MLELLRAALLVTIVVLVLVALCRSLRDFRRAGPSAIARWGGALVDPRHSELVGAGVGELDGAGAAQLVGAGVGQLVGAKVGGPLGSGVGELDGAGVGDMAGAVRRGSR